MAETALVDRVALALRQREWEVTPDPSSDGGLHLSPSDGEAPWPLVVAVDDPVVVVISVLADDVPAQHRPAVLQVLNVANLGLDTSSFDIDPDDGEVRLRTGIDLGAADLDDTVLSTLVGAAVAANLEAMDDWLDQINAVAQGLTLEGD